MLHASRFMTKLGQHFLTSKKIVDEIIKAAEIKPDDTVLEVGPGKGILTEELVKKVDSTDSTISLQASSPQAGQVIAIEKDPDLVAYLMKHEASPKLKIINGDILKMNVSSFKLHVSRYKIVANIPYYITSRFLKNCLTDKLQPEIMVLMLQKEVAERIVARDGKESILSISVKAYGHPKIIKNVPAKYFSPKPKVDSAIIKIDNISKDFFNNNRRRASIIEANFFELVRKGFSSKRKMLKNNLKISGEILKKSGLSEKVRAEELSLENWKYLLQYQYKHASKQD